MRIREATNDDAADVLAVHRAAIEAIEPGTYTAAQLDAWAAAQDDPTQYPFDDESQYLAVAERDAAGVVGFVGVDRGDGVLETLYVHPDHAGAGIGSDLLTHVEGALRAAGHDRVVMAASRNAVPFYEHHGYETTAETFDLEMGTETLSFIRMERRLG
jgi:putative acetyltransferase